MIICLDEVDELGSFVEIEATDPQLAPQVMQQCHSLGLTNLEVGYVELFLRAKDFPLYKQGRYILSSDM